MVNLVGPPMVPGQIYLTRLAGNRPGLVMLKPKKPRRRASAFGIVAIAQAISPFFFTEKSIKELRREFTSQDPSATMEKPGLTAEEPENLETPAGPPASPPVEPPVEPPAEPPAEPLTDLPVDPPEEPAADASADPPAEAPDDPSAEPSNDPPAAPPDPPTDPPAEPSTGPPPDHLPDTPLGPSTHHPPDPPPQPLAKAPTNSPAGPPIAPPLNPGAAITASHVKIQSLVILPTCAHCGKTRSPSYQRRHPLAPDEIPEVGFCRNCAKKETSSEGSDDDNNRYRRKHRRRHLRSLGRETWAEYLGLTDKSYHPIVQTSRQRPSRKPLRGSRPSGSKKMSKASNGKRQKKKITSLISREATLSDPVGQKISPEPVRIERRTTNANGSSRAQSGGTPRASSREGFPEKKAQDTPSTRSATSPEGRLPSIKPIRKVRHTTYIYKSKPSQAGSVSRSSNNANLIDKRVEELSINNDEDEPGLSFNVDLKPEEASETRRPTRRQVRSLLLEPCTPEGTHLHHYFDRGRAPYARSGRADYINGFSYHGELLDVEDIHRSRTRSVRLIRVGGKFDSLLSSSSSAQTSPGAAELALRPPSRTARVLKAQSDGLRSRPRSPRNDPAASETRRGSRLPSRSVRVFRVDSDGLNSRPHSPRNEPPASESGRGSRPPSRSVRVFRVDSDGLRLRPQSPKNGPPAVESGPGSRPRTRSVRVIRVPSDGLRSSLKSSKDDRALSELDRESRSPSRSVRVLRINPEGFRSHPQSPTNDRAPSEPGRESRPPSRPIRAHRINPDGIYSYPHSPTDDRAPSEPERQSRPSSGSIRVVRVQPDVLPSRPQSSAMNETASKSDQSLLAPRSEQAVRARPDGTYSRPVSAQAIPMATESYGSRPSSRSVRVLRVPDMSPQRMQPPTQSYGPQPPSRSNGKVRVSQEFSRLRSNSRDLRTAAHELDEPRPRSSSVRLRRIYNEVEDVTSHEIISPDWSSIRQQLRSPSPICGGSSREGAKRLITQRQSTRYYGSESSRDSVSIPPPPKTHGSIHSPDSNTNHPLHILRMRHQSTHSDPEKYHPSDRNSAPVSPLGKVFGVRYVSPRAPTSRSLSRPHQPEYRDEAPPAVSGYQSRIVNRAAGSGRIKYSPNEDWHASNETSPRSNQANRSGEKYHRPNEDRPESLESSHGNSQKWRENRANSEENNENRSRVVGHLPARGYPDLNKRVSRSGRKTYRSNEDWPESPEISQGSSQEWHENKANSQEKKQDWAGDEEQLPQRNEDWGASKATSRTNSPGSNTLRSRAVSKSSEKRSGEAAAAEW